MTDEKKLLLTSSLLTQGYKNNKHNSFKKMFYRGDCGTLKTLKTLKLD